VTVKLNGASRLPAVATNTPPPTVAWPPARFPSNCGMVVRGSKAITFGAAAVTLVMLTIRRLIAVTALVFVRSTLARARELMA
jgi:hypothetical protein